MNKSEFEKEAEEYGKKYSSRLERKLGFQAGAEFAHREDEKRIAELGKENAEAKEIIKHLLDWQYDEYKKSETDKEMFKVIAEAEQFLKEVEE